MTNLCIITPFDSLPCIPKAFSIRGKSANWKDFGYRCDRYTGGTVNDFGCMDGGITTIAYESNLETAKKYNLTEEEYNEVCKALEEKLHVGCCSRCAVREIGR